MRVLLYAALIAAARVTSPTERSVVTPSMRATLRRSRSSRESSTSIAALITSLACAVGDVFRKEFDDIGFKTTWVNGAAFKRAGIWSPSIPATARPCCASAVSIRCSRRAARSRPSSCLLAATRVERRAKPILWGVGAFMLVTLVLWIRNAFGAGVVIAWGIVLLLIAQKGTAGRVAGWVLTVLGVQVALNAVLGIRALFLVQGHSDAQTMAQLFLAPAWFWAGLWMAISIAMLVWTLRATRGR